MEGDTNSLLKADSKVDDGQKEIVLETNNQVNDEGKIWRWDYIFLVVAALCSTLIIVFAVMKMFQAAYSMITVGLAGIVVFGLINFSGTE